MAFVASVWQCVREGSLLTRVLAVILTVENASLRSTWTRRPACKRVARGERAARGVLHALGRVCCRARSGTWRMKPLNSAHNPQRCSVSAA